jgi:hypothetical protein
MGEPVAYDLDEAKQIARRLADELEPQNELAQNARREREQERRREAGIRLREAARNVLVELGVDGINANCGDHWFEVLFTKIEPGEVFQFVALDHSRGDGSDWRWMIARKVKNTKPTDCQWQRLPLSYSDATGRIESEQPDPQNPNRRRSAVAVLVDAASLAITEMKAGA